MCTLDVHTHHYRSLPSEAVQQLQNIPIMQKEYRDLMPKRVWNKNVYRVTTNCHGQLQQTILQDLGTA